VAPPATSNEREVSDTSRREFCAVQRCNADIIARMNDELNAQVAGEIGTDDGSYLPLSGFGGWNLQVAIE
jgi:hypothetical protein